MKPREFWIHRLEFNRKFNAPLVVYNKSEIKAEPDKWVHVREVVPIDWAKVWDNIQFVSFPDFQKIKQQVEKQLNGDE